jgi:inorganic triphosphatase YgiF
MSPESQEVEAALLIAADDAPEIARRIARLTELAGHALVARADQKLHDVFYDRAEHALQSKGLALRTRLQNNSQLITLKGQARVGEGGAVSRMEIEEAWSAQGFTKTVDELARQQISIDRRVDAFDSHSPAEVMRASGFVSIQNRRTHRRVRDVMRQASDVRLAELAIDAVDFQFGDARVSLFEVEIEAKHRDGHGAIQACAAALQTDFGVVLRPWPYGKLATGAAIERLLRTGELTPLLVNAQLVGARASLLLEDRLRA